MMKQSKPEAIGIRHRGGNQTAENYRGIPIHAATGVHQAVLDELVALIGPTGRVLDLGAGQGALSQRLADVGFEVVAVDLSNEGWAAMSVTCNVVDLNRSWEPVYALGPFDAICAVEVIEHLENPRDFLRHIVSLPVSRDAPVVITSPNPLDTFSTITLFTRGTFNWFSPAHYGGGGHISILPFWMIDMHLQYLGQSPCEWRYISKFRHRGSLSHLFYSIILSLRGLVAKSRDRAHFDGEAAVGTFRVSTLPDEDANK